MALVRRPAHLVLLVFLAGCSTTIAPPSGGQPDAGGFGEWDDGSGDGTGGDDGTGIPGPDESCSADPCSLTEQCGCGAEQACDLSPTGYAQGVATCRKADPAGTSTASCVTNEQCAAGYSCVDRQCRQMCDDSGDCGGNRCDEPIPVPGGSGDVPGVATCSKTCKLEQATGGGCPADPDLACRYKVDAAGFYTDCLAATRTGGGNGVACGEASGYGAACRAGYDCWPIAYDDGSQRDECRQVCVIAVGGAPTKGTCAVGACVGFADPASGNPGLLIGDVEYGVCL
jgi:hypothetical protein